MRIAQYWHKYRLQHAHLNNDRILELHLGMIQELLLPIQYEFFHYHALRAITFQDSSISTQHGTLA